MKGKLSVVLGGLVLINVVLLILYFLLSSPRRDNIQEKYTQLRITSPKRLYRLTSGIAPLGVRQVESIESGDDRNRFEVSGFLVEPPTVKSGGVYLSIALDYSRMRGYIKKIPVFLGRLEEEIGVNIASGGQESTHHIALKVKDISHRLKPHRQVLLKITTAVSDSVLQNPRCKAKPSCAKRVKEINAYGEEVEPYLLDLSRGKFYSAPKPLGVVAEIIFID